MVTNSGIATIGERARASITNPSYVIRVSAEISSRDLGHETAVVVPDYLPYDLVVLHFLANLSVKFEVIQWVPWIVRSGSWDF